MKVPVGWLTTRAPCVATMVNWPTLELLAVAVKPTDPVRLVIVSEPPGLLTAPVRNTAGPEWLGEVPTAPAYRCWMVTTGLAPGFTCVTVRPPGAACALPVKLTEPPGRSGMLIGPSRR